MFFVYFGTGKPWLVPFFCVFFGVLLKSVVRLSDFLLLYKTVHLKTMDFFLSARGSYQ